MHTPVQASVTMFGFPSLFSDDPFSFGGPRQPRVSPFAEVDRLFESITQDIQRAHSEAFGFGAAFQHQSQGRQVRTVVPATRVKLALCDLMS